MGINVECMFVIKKGLLSSEQEKSLSSICRDRIVESENQETDVKQTVYRFGCSGQTWNDNLIGEIADLIDNNSDSCGGITQADHDGPSTNITEYGDPEGCGIIVDIIYKWGPI